MFTSRIIVERPVDPDLWPEVKGCVARHVWEFMLSDNHLYVYRYAIERRPTTRHKFKPVEWYIAHDKRNNTISASGVPLPDDVKQEALDKLTNQITITVEVIR